MQRRNKTSEPNIQTVVSMAALSSEECVQKEGSEPRRVLSGIDLTIGRGQSWGITARTGFEIRLLLEVMGNIRPYGGGKCVLIERGMLRRKRVILPHVFYIGDTDMLYDNMNALEYLMFATENLRDDRLSMQEELFDLLIGIGIGHISLSGIRWMTEEEKSVLALIAAAYSNCLLIVFNLPEASFDDKLRGAVARVAERITQRGKTLVIGTKDCSLIQAACSHTAFITGGRILYQGTTEELRQTWDKVAVVVNDPDIASVRKRLEPVLANCTLAEKDGSLLIKAEGEAAPSRIFRQIAETGVVPRSVQVNEKTVGNAYEELIQKSDLSEQLF